MQLIPAIDIRHGQCVRLLKGDFDRVTEYPFDPRALARDYADRGAAWLHVVDLDGAETGAPVNGQLIREIAGESGLHVQVGGGIRSRTDLETVLGYADRAVVGSLAATDPDTVAGWIGELGPERVALGLDVRLSGDGEPFLTTHGWTRSSELTLSAAIERYAGSGLRHVLCTDVDKDGAMGGPNLELYAHCAKRWPAIEFQASGGVRDASDLERLAGTGVASAISGKALLEKRISFEEIVRFLPNA